MVLRIFTKFRCIYVMFKENMVLLFYLKLINPIAENQAFMKKGLVSMDIQKIINELVQNDIIHTGLIETKQLNGGTVSELYLLKCNNGHSYVVKLNEPKILKSETEFLHTYKELNLLPNLLTVEPSYKYIVYSFISGTTNDPIKNKQDMLITLVQGLINHYKTVPKENGWGWADEVTDSWESFLFNKAFEAEMVLNSYLEKDDYTFVVDLIRSSNISQNKEPFLLHGDCGVHNFVFHEGKLTGVIDPTPVFGDPLYDIIYAFCSSPDDLTKQTIDSAVSHLNIKGFKNYSHLYEAVIIGLYLRLGTCLKHHPGDFEKYLEAWNYWKKILDKR